MTNIIVYVSTLVSMMVLDFVWLFGIARSFYVREFGSLARSASPSLMNVIAGLSVYVLMALGIVVFVLPKVSSLSLPSAFLVGALFGIILYGVYDGTNYFILNNYSGLMAIVDVVWGGVCMGVATTVAKIVLEKVV